MPFVIDIDPVVLHLGMVELRWYGLIAAAAGGVAVWLFMRAARRAGIDGAVAGDGVVWVAIAALAGARILYVVQNELPAVAADPAHAVMVWQGGLSYYGGLVGGLVALALFARRRGLSIARLADAAAPAVALGQAIGHLGCLIGGDSYGIPTTLPWAVVYENPGAVAPLGVPLHPTQAYEAIGLAVLFGALLRWGDALGRLGPGAVAGAYLVGLSTLRFVLFFLRDEPAVLLGLKTAQWIGLGLGALGLVILVALVRTRRARSAGSLLPEVITP